MKIIGICGSPRNKNTYNMIRVAIGGFGDVVNLKEKKISPCNDCRRCHKTGKCDLSDQMNGIYEKLEQSDAIVLGSPTYFDNVSGLMKNFMDRCLPYYFSRKLEGKKAVLLTCANFKDQIESDKNGKCKWHKDEIASANKCLNSMEYFCKILGIRVMGSVYSLHDDWQSGKEQIIRTMSELKRA